MKPPLRVLPAKFGPLHQETLGSYLNRLASANRLQVTTLSALILDRNWSCGHDTDFCPYWTPDAFERLAQLISRPVRALTHALPRVQLDALSSPWKPSGDGHLRPICHGCSARRGWQGLAIRRCHHHETICRRHRRWIARSREFDLRLLPWTHPAHLAHSRLVRRHGPSTVDRAFRDALHEIARQFNRFGRSPTQLTWHDRLETIGEDPYGNPFQPTSERLEIVTYPEAIELAASLATRPARIAAEVRT